MKTVQLVKHKNKNWEYVIKKITLIEPLVLVFGNRLMLEDDSIYEEIKEMFPGGHIIFGSACAEISSNTVNEESQIFNNLFHSSFSFFLSLFSFVLLFLFLNTRNENFLEYTHPSSFDNQTPTTSQNPSIIISHFAPCHHHHHQQDIYCSALSTRSTHKSQKRIEYCEQRRSVVVADKQWKPILLLSMLECMLQFQEILLRY